MLATRQTLDIPVTLFLEPFLRIIFLIVDFSENRYADKIIISLDAFRI